MGIRVFIVEYEMECEKTLFSKTRCTGESLVTGMSRKFHSPVSKLGQTVLFVLVVAFFGRIRLPPTVTGWAASCGDGP